MKSGKAKNRAIFLDRDGCINKWVGFLKSKDEMVLLDGVAEAIRNLNDEGWLCIVVTNQPLVGQGVLSELELGEIHDKMRQLLANEGAYIDDIYYCPHNMTSENENKRLRVCFCHKPEPGLVLKAAEEHDIELESSWFVGDSWRDVMTGINAGCRTVLLTGTGGEKSRNPRDVKPDKKYSTLLDFVRELIRNEENLLINHRSERLKWLL